MNDTFTILTTSYNNRKYLKDWADSVLAQKYRPLQVVFVDDFSKTRDSDYALTLKNKFNKNNIDLVIRRLDKNVGCSSAYREALSVASGDFFGVLDSDDSLVVDAVSDIMNIYKERENISYIYTQFSWCNKNLQIQKKGFCKLPQKGLSLLDSEMSEKTRHCFSHWRTFSRRVEDPMSVFKPGLKSSVDKYMGYRLEEMGVGSFYDKPCYNYRSEVTGSITRTSGDQVPTWRKVRRDARVRRNKRKIKTYPIKLIKHK